MSSILPLLFKKEDEPLLNFLSEEGQSIEPEWYLPILPLVLINGSSGIGTGYSTLIPQHNPLDIIDKIHYMMDLDDEKNGDFGDGRSGISEQKRTVLREVFGEKIEENQIVNFIPEKGDKNYSQAENRFFELH